MATDPTARSTPPRPPSSCPSCGAEEILEVTATVVGLPVSASMCASCEWVRWHGGGQLEALGDAIGRMREGEPIRRYRAAS